MEIYRKRWKIENFFNENAFLGVDRLPSRELNAIRTALTLKMEKDIPAALGPLDSMQSRLFTPIHDFTFTTRN